MLALSAVFYSCRLLCVSLSTDKCRDIIGRLESYGLVNQRSRGMQCVIQKNQLKRPALKIYRCTL